ncbi:MAG: AraC family transcriptional regulator [Fimbriimonadaceae bacterium]|nr:AraC family transcriptional regulator [Fimbriimonadaceae bacterium]
MEFYGRQIRANTLDGMRVIELVYPASLMMPMHVHDNPYITFILAGSCVEHLDNGSRELNTRTLAFTPAGMPHADQIGPEEMHSINIEFFGERGRHLTETTRVLEVPHTIEAGPAIQLAERLYAEIRRNDAVATLAIESVVLDILTEAARLGNPTERDIPKWILTAKSFIESNYSKGLKVREIADLVGVHPIHLTRMFQRHFDCSIAEYVRELRLAAAVRLVRDTELPLSQIAVQTGFADQSHLTRTFQTSMGMTPARFRRNRFAL